MLQPSELYEHVAQAGDQGRPVMIQVLDGFVDAGGARRGVRTQLMDQLTHRVLVRFDVDALHDYRARRPMMEFARDHWAGYDGPALELHEVLDQNGARFLLLTGPEPDVLWERFTSAVIELVTYFDVSLVVGLNAIPMAVPHTRPAGVTAHATRSELISDYRPWLDSVHVPGSIGHLLEYRLGQAGLDAVGLAVHVPQYLSAGEYPVAALTLVEHLNRLTGLTLPTDALSEAGELSRSHVDSQVAQAEDVAAMVAQMEAQYDAFLAERETTLAEDGPLPSGDELGAALERFLAEQPEDEG